MSPEEVPPESPCNKEETKTEPPVEPTAAVEDIESLKAALAQEKTKAESYMASWQRAQADYINLKRRSEMEKNETATFANAALIASILPVIDDLERALGSLPAKLASLSWVDGLKLVSRKAIVVLEKQGVSEIKALGEPFDPNFHQAALHSNGEPGKVIEVLQKGYKLHDKVIRPATVVVGEAKKEDKQPKPSAD